MSLGVIGGVIIMYGRLLIALFLGGSVEAQLLRIGRASLHSTVACRCIAPSGMADGAA